MRTNTYEVSADVIGQGAFVHEYDNVELRCECALWRQAKASLDGGNNTYPVPVCIHMLAVQRRQLDRGFMLKVTGGIYNPWVGWDVRPGGFTTVTISRVDSTRPYWHVCLPDDLAPHAPLDSQRSDGLTDWRTVGLFHSNAGRFELAQTVAPYYALNGLDAACSKCGKHLWEGRRRPPEGLEHNQFRLESILWSNDLRLRAGICAGCDLSDLIPKI